MIIFDGEIETVKPEETRQVGRLLGERLRPGDIVVLSGDLGSGKTVLAQGILTARLGEGHYPSPTFTLVNSYPGGLYHLDLYRLTVAAQIEDLGYEELFNEETVAVVEWGERGEAYLPAERLEISFAGSGEQRRLGFHPRGPRAEALARDLFLRLEDLC